MTPLQIVSFPSQIFRSALKFEPDYLHLQAVERAEADREQARVLFEKVYPSIRRFPYVYFTAGVTEAIDRFLDGRATQVFPNEYRYVFSRSGVTIQEQSSLFLSSPYSADGKHKDLREYRTHSEIILDCSYLLASDLKHDQSLPGNVSTVMFGFSKSHDLADVRSGVVFTHRKIPGWHTLQYDYGYIGAIHREVMKVVNSQELNHLWVKNKRFEILYQSIGLEIGNTLLFGVNPNTGTRVPYYSLLS